MEEALYYLGFSLFPGIGPVTFEKLLHAYGSAKKAWETDEAELETLLGEARTKQFCAFKHTINLEKSYEQLTKQQITLLTLSHPCYPVHLRTIPHPPFVLYIKGNTSVFFESKMIGVVGTRKMTAYGREVTQMITRELVAQGFVIVSGLAFGVDATSHLTTLQHNGQTIAVLGCGVDCCTSSANQYIYDAILSSGGAIVSTVPPGIGATKGSFPMRNSIIAGLSQALVVTEGAIDSGSLITASFAKKYGRPVFAVPGPITSSLSQGTNVLLNQGATAITSMSDILDTLGILKQSKTAEMARGDSPEEQEILDILQNGPLLFDEIVRTIKRDSKEIGSLLSLMELKGLIQSRSDGRYSIAQ